VSSQIAGEREREREREEQLEYSFRCGLMGNYADFSICTSDALNFTCQRFKTAISPEWRSELLGLYQRLPRFDDRNVGARLTAPRVSALRFLQRQKEPNRCGSFECEDSGLFRRYRHGG
jgi:2-haloacid dehalogenase